MSMTYFKRVLYVLLLIVGGLLVLDGLVLMTVLRFSIGLAGTLVLGFYMAALGLKGLFFSKCFRAGWKRVLLNASLCCFIFFLASVGILALYGSWDTATYEEDALIVLGAGLRGETVTMPLAYRLKSAAAYHKKNPDALIVVSGGMGRGETITEAQAMERFLISLGVAPTVILREDQSTSTYENFLFSKTILDERLGTSYTAAFVSNGFHIYRAEHIGKNAGVSAKHLHAPLDFYMAPVTYIREFFAMGKFLAVGR